MNAELDALVCDAQVHGTRVAIIAVTVLGALVRRLEITFIRNAVQIAIQAGPLENVAFVGYAVGLAVLTEARVDVAFIGIPLELQSGLVPSSMSHSSGMSFSLQSSAVPQSSNGTAMQAPGCPGAVQKPLPGIHSPLISHQSVTPSSSQSCATAGVARAHPMAHAHTTTYQPYSSRLHLLYLLRSCG